MIKLERALFELWFSWCGPESQRQEATWWLLVLHQGAPPTFYNKIAPICSVTAVHFACLRCWEKCC